MKLETIVWLATGAPLNTGRGHPCCDKSMRVIEHIEEQLGGDSSLREFFTHLMERYSTTPLTTFQFINELNHWSGQDFTELFGELTST